MDRFPQPSGASNESRRKPELFLRKAAFVPLEEFPDPSLNPEEQLLAQEDATEDDEVEEVLFDDDDEPAEPPEDGTQYDTLIAEAKVSSGVLGSEVSDRDEFNPGSLGSGVDIDRIVDDFDMRSSEQKLRVAEATRKWDIWTKMRFWNDSHGKRGRK